MFYSDENHNELKHGFLKLISSAYEIKLISPFITKSAFNIFLKEFDYFFKKGGKLKIITTNFDLNSSQFNILDLKEIKEMFFDQIEINVQLILKRNDKPLHMKAYIFKSDNGIEVILGSSNFTFKGLDSGEFNFYFKNNSHAFEVNERFDKILEEQKYNWKKIEDLSESDFIIENFLGSESTEKIDLVEEKKEIILRDFQEKIINLFEAKKSVQRDHLIVLPTGTGKTIVSLFIYKNFLKNSKKKRLLFIAHRREIVENAYKTFRNSNINCVFVKNKDTIFTNDYNIFITTRLLFNMINRNVFHNLDFGLIIYDEAHHINHISEKNQFNLIFEFFKPENNIALTATPERTDGVDISTLFNEPLFEMRLHEALEKKLVANFNYFLVKNNNQSEIKGADIKNSSVIYKKLNTEVRQDIFLNSIKSYISNTKNKTIVFCINKKHAEETYLLLIEKKYKAALLVEGTKNRNLVIDNFVKGNTNFICVVDIFNEGIDIPEITNLIFLRPTKSKIVFLQQLGRGLRKIENKILNVIDIVDNIDDKNYWREKLACFLKKDDIERILKNKKLESNVNLVFDELSYETIIDSFKKKITRPIKKYFSWETMVHSDFEDKNFTLKIILSESKKDIVSIFRIKNDNLLNINDDFIYNKKQYYSNVVDFKGLSINNLVKKFSNFEEIEHKFKIEDFELRSNEFIYNYLVEKMIGEIEIEPNSLLYKKFKFSDGFEFFANILVLNKGFLLLKDSYIKPFSNREHNKTIVSMWNDENNFDSKINKKNGLITTSKDIFFKSRNLLANFITGGKVKSPLDLFVTETKISLNKHYKKKIIEIIGVKKK